MISTEEALAIARATAERGVAQPTLEACAGYPYTISEILSTRWHPYNLPDTPAWYVLLPWYDGHDGRSIRSSRLMVIAKSDGRVLYDGSAGDEG